MGIIANITGVAVNRQTDTKASVIALGAPSSLGLLNDVNVTNKQDGSILVYSAATQKFTSVPNLDGGTF